MNGETNRYDELRSFVESLHRLRTATADTRAVIEERLNQLNRCITSLETFEEILTRELEKAERGEMIGDADFKWVELTVQLLSEEIEIILKGLRSGKII